MDEIGTTTDGGQSPSGRFRIVGKVKSAHGLKGELNILLFAGRADWLDRVNAPGALQVRFIEAPHAGRLSLTELKAVSQAESLRASNERDRAARIKPFKSGLIARLDGVENRNQAEEFEGKLFAIPAELLVGEEEYFLAELEGYLVIDQRLGEIGLIEDFGSNGAQDLLLVRHLGTGRIVEIPFVGAWVASIDQPSESGDRIGNIRMEVPEGLIELQTEDTKKNDEQVG